MIDAIHDTTPAAAERLVIKQAGRLYFVAIADLDWVEAASNYVRLHVGAEVHLMRETLSRLAERLSNGRFLRIHRTTIINVDRIREIQPWFSGEYIVTLNDGTKLKVSRGYRGEVARWMGKGS
ncbi:MAG TPA: LytTR family DNA-binding domain-containing protein [Gemmatimonadales bacterium]|nr:LytTR family DNA-binding domain-containing protein [Gemmatimonadales bacterium]